MTLTHEEILEILAQYEQEGSGGGGIIGKATFSMGYKAMLNNYANEETWWPFELGVVGSKEQAESKCQVAINESGQAGKSPHLSYGFILYKDSSKGREVSWQQDRYFIYPVWSHAIGERDEDGRPIMEKDENGRLRRKPGPVKVAVRDLRIPMGDFWGRWAWTTDPSRTEQDQDGNERQATIAYPVEVYASEAEATAAAGGETVYAPPEWLVDMVGGIKADREANLHLSAVRAKYSVDEETATALKSSDLSKVADAIATMTGESATVIASLL